MKVALNQSQPGPSLKEKIEGGARCFQPGIAVLPSIFGGKVLVRVRDVQTLEEINAVTQAQFKRPFLFEDFSKDPVGRFCCKRILQASRKSIILQTLRESQRKIKLPFELKAHA